MDGEQLIEADDTFTFDSYMKDESDLEIGDLRLLEVDNRLVLPVQKHIRVIVTAADVLHCGHCLLLDVSWQRERMR